MMVDVLAFMVRPEVFDKFQSPVVTVQVPEPIVIVLVANTFAVNLETVTLKLLALKVP
jgi:hypothetical protein